MALVLIGSLSKFTCRLENFTARSTVVTATGIWQMTTPRYLHNFTAVPLWPPCFTYVCMFLKSNNMDQEDWWLTAHPQEQKSAAEMLAQCMMGPKTNSPMHSWLSTRNLACYIIYSKSSSKTIVCLEMLDILAPIVNFSEICFTR